MNQEMRGYMWAVGLFASGVISSQANPTGGQVASGVASIASAPGTVTVTQKSNIAIINWQTFSIASGELTKFVQPSAASAVLNRVLGGQVSTIDGTLTANGQVYIINGNGVIVGPGGVVTANAFTASTRDISDANFLAGSQHFTGSSDAGVQNLGTINAIGGDVYLIGKTVDNQGTINAAKGTVGLAAGDDILLAQKNPDGSTLTVMPSTTATAASGKTAVSNSGTIAASNAELKAANGNLYALAINNSGTIRATTVRHQGGRILLTTDSGKLVNSGVLSASSTAKKGKGGTIKLINTAGTTTDSGKIIAQGGTGGVGGSAEVSGHVIQYTGTTDLTAAQGKIGDLVLDPYNITIVASGTSTTFGDGAGGITADQNGSILNVHDLENTLATSDITVYTGVASSPGNEAGDIFVNTPITWTSSSTLVLSAAGHVFVNAPITAVNGGLGFNTPIITSSLGNTANVNPAGVTAAIRVGEFFFISGSFVQDSTTLPVFTATTFDASGGTFLRSQGGAGTQASPYVIVDTYGDQGLDTLPGNTIFVYGNGFHGTHTPNGTGGGGGTGTGTTTPIQQELSQPAIIQQVANFDSYTANPPPPLPPPVFEASFTPIPGGGGLVAFNDTDNGGGSVNDGGSKRSGNIASGSSIGSQPTPNALLVSGSGIATMFGGLVSAGKPSAFVVEKVESNLSKASESELNAAHYDHP